MSTEMRFATLLGNARVALGDRGVLLYPQGYRLRFVLRTPVLLCYNWNQDYSSDSSLTDSYSLVEALHDALVNSD